jgi:hypothetical protein
MDRAAHFLLAGPANLGNRQLPRPVLPCAAVCYRVLRLSEPFSTNLRGR